ncbi:MAG: DNA polymerase Y family protein [Acidimicrobiia bacterium]|nr:DNA polymerase Y family protein [Acidimicrobiia bacterium]
MSDADRAVRTMVVWCLDWPTVAAGIDPDQAAMVMEANRVVAASPEARRHGVQRGLRRREAQRRCPQAELLDRDEAREARVFETVVAALEEFTPRIEITRPGRCAFATRGPSRYFGGDESLADQVVARVHEALDQQAACRVGVADGPFAAGLAARTPQAADTGRCVVAPGTTPAFLAPLPITTLEMPELTDVWLRLGLRRLGDLAEVPAADVLGRFGSPGEVAHRLARGLDEQPPEARTPPPDLEVSAELDPPVDRVDQAAFVARTMAEQLHQRLEHDGLACIRVAIEAETEHGEHLVRLWRHEGALTAGAMADRVRWQLDGWLNAAPAVRPSGPLIRLALVPDQVVPATGRQLGFWGGESAADERAARALARVQGLLGPDAVQVPEWRGGRNAGDRIELVSLASVDLAERSLFSPADDNHQAPWPGQVPPPTPVLVHPQPPTAELVDEHDQPVTVTGRGLASAAPRRLSVDDGPWHDVDTWAGPWLIDERWWDPGRHRRRARFQVVTTDGAARLLSLEAGSWTVEASYD